MSEFKKRILIVEDDPHISKVYEIQLGKAGFVTTLARDGEEALKILEAEKPNLVILDLMIPKKDGFWVLEQVRQKPEFSKTPVLVISNLGQKVDESHALELGATEYLIKIDHPIQEVVNKIKTYLKE